MEIDIKLDAACPTPRVLILTAEITEEVHRLVERLSDDKPKLLSGFRGDTLEIIDQDSILRIYAANQKVYILTAEAEYRVRLRLYELEARLDRSRFVRISNSEIINLKKACQFDLSLNGTICVKLCDGSSAYVSRRYVSKIKQVLGV